MLYCYLSTKITIFKNINLNIVTFYKITIFKNINLNFRHIYIYVYIITIMQYEDEEYEEWKNHITAQQCMEEDDVLYLFVIHGGNVSAKRDYLGYKTKTFRNIFMYAKPHMPLNTGQLLPTKFMNVRHSLWKIPDDEDSNFNIIYIPPLLYTLENDPELNPILGLYKFIGNNEPVKLRDYDNLKSEVDGNVKQPITISDMEGYVPRYPPCVSML